jgi:hypothetical protein
MARRLKTRRQAAVKMDMVECEARFGDARVRGVEIPSRRLIVYDSDSEVWAGGTFVKWPQVDGAIVWLRAPHDAPDGAEQRVKSELKQRGAMVKVLPREPAPNELPESATAPDDPTELEPVEEVRGSMRATAEAMAREVSRGDELERLLAALDEALTEAGL